jgi:hypothetical protein
VTEQTKKEPNQVHLVNPPAETQDQEQLLAWAKQVQAQVKEQLKP